MTRMVRVLTALMLLLLVTPLCIAQKSTEKAPIKAFKKGLGYRYTYETKPLVAWNDFFLVMADSPDSLSQLQKARTSGTMSTVFSFAGGALIGWPIGGAIAGGDPNWWLAVAGGGVAVVGIVFSVSSGNQLKKAVDIYNENIALPGNSSKDIKIVFAPTSIYVSVKM